MDSKNLYIPSMGDLEDRYREKLRIDSSKSFVNSIEFNDKDSFFYKFRKKSKSYIEFRDEDNIFYEKYFEFIENEGNDREIEIEDILNKIEYNKFFLNWERRLNKDSHKFIGYGSTEETRYRVDEIRKLENKLNDIINSSPEAWRVFRKNQFIEDINKSRNGELIDVDYVKDAKKIVSESLEMGTPIYIVGHLGSGKTQLATEAAIEFAIGKKMQKELEEAMESFISKNPNILEDEVIKEFGKIYKNKSKYYSSILNGGSTAELEEIQPLFISGSHNLTYEDMFVEKTLTFSHSFSKGSFADYLDMIIGDFYSWMEEHKEDLDQMSNDEQLNLKIQIWKSFSDLLVAKNSGYGTEIKKIEKEILIAVNQGKVVIVDELNTIAMQNLIGLNDILQKHIGSRAYITGVGPVIIKEGFGFIGTGNLSTQLINYEGTNELNPAFKSRFRTIEYNYLPQNLLGNIKEQSNREENQLFRVILSRLGDENGNIHIPDMVRNLDELFKFAQLSKLTQNIFMGKWAQNTIDTPEAMDSVELKESVLSIRNIIHVLDSWNLGEEKDLSKALWDGFISSITEPEDQVYILNQSVRYGFFKLEEGWNIPKGDINYATLSYKDIRKDKYEYYRKDIETYSYLDIIEMLFDNKPIRKELPQEIIEKFQLEYKKIPNIDFKKYEELNQRLLNLEHSVDLMKYLDIEDD